MEGNFTKTSFFLLTVYFKYSSIMLTFLVLYSVLEKQTFWISYRKRATPKTETDFKACEFHH